MKKEKKLKPEELLEYLFIHNPASIPQIAKDLNVNPPTVQYWIDKLIEKDIIMPVYGKRYGEKYQLKIKLRSWKELIIPLIPTMLLIHAIALLPNSISIYIALLSGLIGSATAWLWYVDVIKKKIYEILKEKGI